VVNRPRAYQLIPVVIAIAGSLLLIAQWAGGRPLWLDEEMIAIDLRDRSLRGLAGSLSLGQTAPYGWLVVQRLVLLVAGGGERSLRFVPVLFGVGTLAAAAWIGRRWLNAAGATALVLLCATGRWLTFYLLELKPYSADAFFALLLPALAVDAASRQRTLMFWTAAAAAQWFSNGALLVVPACAVVLAVHSWQGGASAETAEHADKRDSAGSADSALRRRAVMRTLAPAAIWIGSFAVHYAIALQHALGSSYLQGTWAFAFPPPDAGLVDRIIWFGRQLAPFAAKPGGSTLGLTIWMAAAAGFTLADDRRRSLALAFGLVPILAFVYAIAHVVPLYERVSIWMVPALYVGIALLADVGSRRWTRRSTVTVAGAVVALVLTVDVAAGGLLDLRGRPSTSNRSLDDRAAIHWLAARAEPGDAWVTTHFALPALWWYGGATTVDRVFELSYSPDPAACGSALADTLRSFPRAIVYLGFRFDDTPPGFDDLLVDRLAELGAVTAFRRFDVRSIALVVDRRQRANAPASLSRLDASPTDTAVRAPGCIGIRPAAVW